MEHTRSKIILVDDNMSNLTQGRNMLKTFYEVYSTPSAALAIDDKSAIF
jgi:hypothetical protein